MAKWQRGIPLVAELNGTNALGGEPRARNRSWFFFVDGSLTLPDASAEHLLLLELECRRLSQFDQLLTKCLGQREKLLYRKLLRAGLWP